MKKSGRPKGSKNSAEVIAKVAKAVRASKWRRQTQKHPANFQSSSGFAGVQDYSTFGQTGHRHMLWEEGHGNSNWWGYDD